MNVLLIAPEFPPNFFQFATSLSACGHPPFAMGQADFAELSPALRQALRWYVRCDLNDRHAFLAALQHLTRDILPGHGWGRLDIVESHNEHWMAHEALANETLALTGIRPADIEHLQNKARMKEIFRDAQLPGPRGDLVNNAEEALRLGPRLGFPQILKPAVGVGAGGVRRIDSFADLSAAAPTIRTPHVLEEFITAPIVTYDGLVDWHGRVVFDNMLVYGAGVLEALLGGDAFFHTSREIPPPLREAGQRLVQEFGIRRKFFHFEFFDVEGRYVPIEINARPPGGPILDMMNYSFDGNLYKTWAEIVAAPTATPASQGHLKPYHCAYASRRHRRYRHSHEEIVKRLGSSLMDYCENPPLFQAAMGQYRYIFRSKSRDEVNELGRFIQDVLPE